MHIVIIGLGEVGRALVAHYVDGGHDVVAIDQSKALVERIREDVDATVMMGHGANQELLEKAEVGGAHLVVAVTDNDEVNVLAAIMAKHRGARKVIARVQGDEMLKNERGILRDLMGIDLIINPRVLVALELARLCQGSGAVEVIELADDSIELVRVHVTEDSRVKNKPLSVLKKDGTLIAALIRGGEKMRIPGGADTLQPGDQVYLAGLRDHIRGYEAEFTSQRLNTRALIAGGGLTGELVARKLRADGTQVRMIEPNPERGAELEMALGGDRSRFQVKIGTATDLEILQEELRECDVFAAVTPSDETNLMAALLAKRHRPDSERSKLITAAIVQRPETRSVLQDLGVDIVVSPRSVASEYILREGLDDQLKKLTRLDDQATVFQVTARAGSDATRAPVRDLSLPRGSLLIGVVNRDGVEIPGGSTNIGAEARVLALVVDEKDARPTRLSLERLFGQGRS